MRIIGRNRIRKYPVDQVTSRNSAAEEDPRAAGLSQDDVEAIWRSVTGCYRRGLHPAIGFCLRRRGKVVIDRAIGHVQGNAPDEPSRATRVPVRYDSLFNLYSASKSITAMLMHLLDQRQMIHLDDPVAEYIPEFRGHGKRKISIRHILTHRAGLPTIPGDHVDLDLLADWDRIIKILCDAKPKTVAGRQLEYHALTGGFILGEVVRRVTGRDVRTFLQEEVLGPLGFRNLNYGVSEEDLPRVARNAVTGPKAPLPIAYMLKRSLGIDFPSAVKISNDPRFLQGVIPSGNIITTANETSRFYQLLLNRGKLDGKRIFERRTVNRAVAEQTYLEVDLTIGLPVRYGMGFMLGADYMSFYGPGTPRAFGHIGFTNVVCWADPERDISVALMTSGKPLITPRAFSWMNIMLTVNRRCPRKRTV